MSIFNSGMTSEFTGVRGSHQTRSRSRFLLEKSAIADTFRFVIKRFAICPLVLLGIIFFMSGCSSLFQSTASNQDTVPGERVSDEGRLAPGSVGTTPNASVKW